MTTRPSGEKSATLDSKTDSESIPAVRRNVDKTDIFEDQGSPRKPYPPPFEPHRGARVRGWGGVTASMAGGLSTMMCVGSDQPAHGGHRYRGALRRNRSASPLLVGNQGMVGERPRPNQTLVPRVFT